MRASATRSRAEGRQASGFTLIEMLVVIAVIAILAGILLPVYTSAQKRASLTACASNLKQLGVAMKQYASDHKSQLPDWAPTQPLLGTVAVDWRKGADHRAGLAAVGRALRQYASGDNGVFFCPEDLYEDVPERGGSDPEWATAGAVDNGLLGYCSVANWVRKSGQMYSTLVTNNGRLGRLGDRNAFVSRGIDEPSANVTEVAVLADNGLFFQVENQSTWPHDGTGNVLFLDGSVRAMPRNGFLSEFAPVEPSQDPVLAAYTAFKVDAVN